LWSVPYGNDEAHSAKSSRTKGVVAFGCGCQNQAATGGWLVVVALETPPLLAIVAQNASVPSYGWGSFSSSRSCSHQHRGGWPSLSPSFLPSTVTAWAAPASNGVVTGSSRLLISALTFAQLKWLSGPDQNTTFVGVTNCCPQPPAGAFVFLVGGLGSELSSIELQWCA